MQTELDLFDPESPLPPQWVAAQAVVLPGFALPQVEVMLPLLRHVVAQAPFRHMLTPGGLKMAVGLTNCGALGWVSDRQGYRYSPVDPLSNRPWPELPGVLLELASRAALVAGFTDFQPDACLVNCYRPGNRLSLHQDRDERDFTQPIVSVSLGLPAVFLLGGHSRSEPTQRIGLRHGDVLVWGGDDRLRFHGVLPLKAGAHPQLGSLRINLTLRKAG
ncbi:DNA oxidative demethylase AlkB [Pseudomonas sp. P66]|jgi:alkylated DNA repair protein (DNA oxidative demethylase)|uniref:DNA oxidative demethylase AlkB n=2 Tax=Pseudomonas TaxID=286 RepID=A0AB35WWW0_9PSED|nr:MULTISPECIES: DNA oxidative demethylase AlkB [Pseudomonas]MBM3112844.1 DNA oxidative demethylase AlkB [Pseudomonas arcuscaelestis]MBM5459128.1 DNA oxidative demethylase AlkB [Pseudomonas arcuscaelestis]MEE1869170.1 DNA oxidative demethylase AlkB [Pseudomonas sp. 120P]MEE1959924.1 DNA oxidative demethylase AlkB [Pseudomonas sp. 119P]